jgi:tetratricopeptide (TPR) repeat protein
MPEDHQSVLIDDGALDYRSLVLQARRSVRAGDLAGALASWSALRAQYPQDAGAVVGMGHALIGLGRLDEADALAETASAHVVTAAAAVRLRARLAEKRRDWEAALAHWRSVAEREPQAEDGWLGASQALCRLGRFSEADALLVAALRARPGHFALLCALCRVPEANRDFVEAERRWRVLAERQPDRPEPLAGASRALLGQGSIDQCEAMAQSCVARFPSHSDAYVTLARAAMARLDWTEAARRWSEVEARFPLHPAAPATRRHCEDRARLIAGDMPLHAVSRAEAPPAPDVSVDWTLDRSDAAQVRGFLLQFESLGRNCEFGLVQRSFGAEPLGLLRWANTGASTLIAALTARFEGVGTPEQTELMRLRGEYGAEDKRYKFGIHLGIKEAEAEPERVFKTQCRRIGFLRDKLLGELDNQEKIFVYSSFALADDRLAAIIDCLDRYGPNRLLCVRGFTDSQPPGSMEILSDRVVVGYTAQEALERGTDGGWKIPIDHWLNFCEAAWRLKGQGFAS